LHKNLVEYEFRAAYIDRNGTSSRFLDFTPGEFQT
jgi:hypothetical protein